MTTCLRGDATDEGAWRALLGSSLADAVVTDPPYCLLTRRRKDGRERDTKDRKVERGPLRRFETVRAYRTFTRAWLTVARRFARPSAPLVTWTNLLGRAPIIDEARAAGWPVLRGEYVWGKRTREGNSGEELLRVVETALVFTAHPPGEVNASDPALPWAVVAGYDDDGEAERWGAHPSHKPWGVLEPLVRTWTRPGQLVVDPFSGSASIGAAALRLGRRVAALELDPRWAELGEERLRAAVKATTQASTT